MKYAIYFSVIKRLDFINRTRKTRDNKVIRHFFLVCHSGQQQSVAFFDTVISAVYNSGTKIQNGNGIRACYGYNTGIRK